MPGLPWGRAIAGKTALIAALVVSAATLISAPHPGRADSVSDLTARIQAAVTPSPAATPVPTPTPFAVTIDKDGFHPSGIRIGPGQSVSWINADTVQHTATAADGSWDTGPIDPGHSATLQFFEIGRWEYVCGFKPTLRATLVVATPAPTRGATPPAVLAPTLTPATPTPTPTGAG